MNLSRKEEGNAHILIIGFLCLLVSVFMLCFIYWEKVSNSGYEQLDSAVTGSLLSALIPNVEMSYASTTGKGIIISSSDCIDKSQVGKIENDPELDRCYSRFLSSLKTNLRLNDNMESENPMICGSIKIKYLKLYEIKRMNSGQFRVTQHLYQNGCWIVERIIEGESLPDIQVYSTWDGEQRKITRTSLEADLEMRLYLVPNGRKLLEQGAAVEEIAVLVDYVRVAEITDELLENW